MTFLWEACPRANMPGSHPGSGCPRLYQTIEVAHMTLFSDAAAMNGAPENIVFEDVNVQFSGMHGQAHDPNSFSYSDGSAQRVDGSPKGKGPDQGRQDPEAAGIFTSTGLIMAYSQDILTWQKHHEYNQSG